MQKLKINGREYGYYNINSYAEGTGKEVSHLPVSIKILLENLLRHEESLSVSRDDIAALADWNPEGNSDRGIAFHPARVVMQDLTGAPAIVDLTGMRDALAEKGGDITKINPQIPVDMVIDHSVMVDYYGSSDAFQKNMEMEFKRNNERYRFFKWACNAFDNFRVIPPETGIIHQVNLEYLAKTVWTSQLDGLSLIYPDTCVGTDSHTTMVNGLSVLGWGVGGIEAEAAMLGQPVTMLIPDVIGFRLEGGLKPGCTATDLVLRVVRMLRQKGVVGKFVEFYGSGLDALSLADRATIANMAPEYGATCGMFPVDDELLEYMRLTGRSDEHISLVKEYAKTQGFWRNDEIPPVFTDTLSLDISSVVPSMAGPKRPQDLVKLPDIPDNFTESLETVFAVSRDSFKKSAAIKGLDHKLRHGDVAIAAITSCTNTSNPTVLIAAGLLARNALNLGIKTKPWVKTSFAPGSRVVTSYLEKAGLTEALDAQGFQLVGYGCTTCIGNSGPLPENVKNAIHEADLVTVNVLSGNRNFEGRINPDSKASYLASPPLVVAYALAGTVLIDFEKEAIGHDKKGREIFLRDLWPEVKDIRNAVSRHINPELFRSVYTQSLDGPESWQALEAPDNMQYDWQEDSTYIKCPPFFQGFEKDNTLTDIKGARCLAIMPDSTTTDHISPAGSIAVNSPAGKYLNSCGVKSVDFNSYGSRRANHEVMVRGTFANIRIKNPMVPGIEGGYTLGPDGSMTTIFDAAMAWKEKKAPLIILAGSEYGTGSSRDWAGKGPMLQGVKAVIAVSYERIHRSNLIGMGILPLEFMNGDNVESLNLNGLETFDIRGISDIKPSSRLDVCVTKSDSEIMVPVSCRIDTEIEMEYWKSGGILNYVLKNMMD